PRPSEWSGADLEGRLRGSGARIPVAEDNPANQQVALGILHKLGLRAEAVGNGREALDALERIPYDLVLMDVQMPEMDGYEATRRIRRSPQVDDPAVPVVAMTAHAMEGDRRRCLEAGMDDYVSKPVAPQALVAVLERLLPRRGDLPAGGGAQPVAAEPGETAVFDREGLLERFMGDEELAREVAAVSLESLPPLVDTLREALAEGDAAGTADCAHTLKGAAASTGGEALREAALQVERHAGAGDLRAAGEAMPALDEDLAALREALEGFLEERGAR
ncbi:MAG: response regulator, partial [Synergistales bacterium]|nr:response regulator [Synergistales bacterium]